MKSLFLQALELDEAKRRAFLDSACGEDTQLRQRVKTLLEADERGDSLFETEAHSLRDLRTKAAPLEGAVLGRYRLLACIGSGGMGDVWSAEDSSLGRKAAIKLLRRHFITDPSSLRRFEREARTLSSLNHPNIITIYEVGEAPPELGSFHFLAVELIEGVTLRERLKGGPLPLKEVLTVALQVTAALHAAHQAGVVHRDIKPDNIMIRPDQVVKVLDFGLAKVNFSGDFELLDGAYETREGFVIGTPHYMSPEAVRGQKVDERADIFSLGVVLYEMVSGRTPFTGFSVPDVFAALLNQDPPALMEPGSAEPLEALERVIGRALEKDAAARYQTVRELASELEDLKWRTESSAPGLRFPTPAPTKPSRHPLYLVAALAGLAVVGAGIYRSSLLSRTRRAASGEALTVPFATFAGRKDFPAFSPDGRQIAFAWDGGRQREDGKRDIYIKLVGVGDPVRMTATPDDETKPAWSPDGKYIAFLRNGSIYVIPSLPGGSERRLAAAGNGMSWSPDAESLAIATVGSKEVPSRIVLVSAETGEPLQQVTHADLPNSDDQPAFSPDGTRIAFFRSFGATRREVFVVGANGGEPKQLTWDKRQIFGLAWTGDGREIVYATNRGGGMALWRISAAGGTPERITVPSLNPTAPATSRQGDRLAYTESYTDSNIYLYEGAGFGNRTVPAAFGEPVPFLNSSRDDHSQQFSPDGQQIVFISMRTGSEELWLSNRTGRELRQLTNFNGSPTGTPRWSPDGRSIAFDTRVTGNAEIFVVSTEGGPPRNVTNSASYDATPSWSRDGKWLYFASDRGTVGVTDMWKQPVGGGPAIRLTSSGGSEGYESTDGKLFYFSKGRGGDGL
ncbi:MAG: LpqB family beta-propeller domain-containing protein, partial [Saprospiraceae bacterium]